MLAKEKTTAEDVKITPRTEDYSQWYLDVIQAADLAEYGPTKGSMILKPSGYAIWEKVQEILNAKFKSFGIQNVYFPMLIPEKFLKKEEAHVEGFSPEVAVVTHAGGAKLEENLIIRPTSETIIYDTFSRWIQSHRDLPMIINQWANVVRWEMRPRLFLRTTEFLWQEGHTAHSNEKEADDYAKQMLEVYSWFAKEIMAIPTIPGEKSESEKFSGALKTYSIETMMQDGKALQFATSHNLGQNFAKAFDIKFTNENSESAMVWQTSWGLSTRTIGGLIMAHGDDKGIILPPKIAPIKVAIMPMWKSEETKTEVIKAATEIHDQLVKVYGDFGIVLDTKDIRIGQKHYYWEKQGVPIRIEIGPRDLESQTLVLVRRDTSEKMVIPMGEVLETIEKVLAEIQKNLYDIALTRQQEKIVEVDNWSDFVKNIEAGNFVRAYWDEDAETEKKIKNETKATVRCLSLTDSEISEGKCVFSSNSAKRKFIFARSY
jgi:prolyl-tRNA synthetase